MNKEQLFLFNVCAIAGLAAMIYNNLSATTHCATVECVVKEAINTGEEINFRFQNQVFTEDIIALKERDTVLCTVNDKNCEIEVLIYEKGKVTITCMNDITKPSNPK